MFLLYNDAHFVFFSKINKQNNKKTHPKTTNQPKNKTNQKSIKCF